MRIIESKSDLDKVTKSPVLSIGNFDGLHLGHQEIIKSAKLTARRRQSTFAVMTFYPHPAAILHPEYTPGVLTPLPLKKHLLDHYGVDCLIVLKDNPELLSLSPQAFIDQFLMQKIKPSVVVEGENFHFGKARAGNIQTLKELGKHYGFEVLIAPAKRIQLPPSRDKTVSSTLIRKLLQKGEVQPASTALGRAYRLIGQVCPGRGKGAKLGFPTANIDPSHQITPEQGVYAGLVAVAESCDEVCTAQAKSPAALSIGKTQTYGTGQPLLIEAHLLMENVGNLIGKWLAMDFVKRIRGQQKFETEKELSAQIANDCQKAKEILTTDCTD